ncbi:DEAD/DEAH box helicase family protein [Kocuria sp.]|uniref:DEAD/DEAH box helicase family protein n=1 Tax=Kocuria sp. TaxID=1871328 RepID=UPI0026E0A86A|nr:DEAD/DEAH box helicase family protein [Kocuria sp.]MDO5618004.1 DEAD/DEAH box helicase family protein [Kocuria sp.]
MSNFGFIQQDWPGVHADARRAESYVSSDPVAACFYSRRAIEQLVLHLYDVMGLPEPYRDDLSARINEQHFKNTVGEGIVLKLNLIRRVGNSAVHSNKSVPPQAAQQVLRELFHVLVFTALRYSTRPDLVPTRAQFDPTLAARAAPLSRQELVALNKKFQEQDQAHAQALKEQQDLAAAKDAEIKQLKEQIAAAQAANNRPDDHDYTEAETRTGTIDIMLGEAGWPLDQKRDREYPVDGMPKGRGYVDYVLWGADGLPLAVVEAKRTARSAQLGQEQARLYAQALEQEFGRRPVIFYTNGHEQWLWDDRAFGDDGGYPPRKIQGFLKRDELELMIQRRSTRTALSTADVDSAIVDRYYQSRAVKAIGAAFDNRDRDALLVMATGAGKTRTVIALVDMLTKANWVKRVLFLADRRALVTQAVSSFKTHLPSSNPVNLLEERHGQGRVYAATYPTIMNLINDVKDGREFSPGHFDLVVIDEAHRSVYQKYRAIFSWFDSYLVGLTATPKEEIDRNTYGLFNLEDGVPTDAYGLDQAIADNYLVPPRGIAVGTRFLRDGIRYDQLSQEERDDWDGLDWGDDGAPDAIDSEEINRFLFNADTVDKVLAQLMTDGHKVAGGDRLGKTIIFAKNQAHAQFIEQRFNIAYPEYGGEFARVITHGNPFAEKLIEDFSQPDGAPHIAISVDMLDTGIDVPEVVNLVFFKVVRSKTKFWQMIGRGTRLCPDLYGPGEDKHDFYVFDFCGNLDYFGQDLPGSEGSVAKSLSQRLFEGRLGLVTALDRAEQHPDLRGATADWLHQLVAGMNLDNFLVRAHRRYVERWAERRRWDTVSQTDVADLLEHVADLPSTVQDTDEDAKRFDLFVLRRQLATLDGDATVAQRTQESIQAIAENLLSKGAIPVVAKQLPLLEEVAEEQWWEDVTLPMLEVMRVRIRGLARFVERTRRNPVYTNFQDALNESREVEMPQAAIGMDWGRFEAKVSALVQQNQDHLTIQRLKRNKQLTAEDLEALEGMLLTAGDEQVNLDWVKDRVGSLGAFVRTLIGLEREAVMEAFSQFLDESRFTAEQIRFIGMVVDELTVNGVMKPERLFESPYTDMGRVDAIFPDNWVEIAGVLRQVESTADPVGVA